MGLLWETRDKKLFASVSSQGCLACNALTFLRSSGDLLDLIEKYSKTQFDFLLYSITSVEKAKSDILGAHGDGPARVIILFSPRGVDLT